MRSPRLIDLFCGAGGMTQGFKQAGFRVVAALDNDSSSIDTYKRNHHECSFILERNLIKYSPRMFKKETGISDIDVIIGGPPCQGFSTASMNPEKKPNFGPNSRYDGRNTLLYRFFDYIMLLKPEIFILENVPSLKSRSNGYYVNKAKKLAKDSDYSLHDWVLNSAEYGVPQKRRRLFLVGFRSDKELKEPKPTNSISATDNTRPFYTVGDAILDLPKLKSDDGEDEMDYDQDRIRQFEDNNRYSHEYAKWSREGSDSLRHHVSRQHSERDLHLFDIIKRGKSSANLSPEQQELIPYNMSCFKDKYRRQPLIEPATTVTAHIAKDGLYYIHPTQRRSLTPREVARLQSFKDSYVFSKYRTPTYHQIGNAVPPLLAESIAKAILNEL